MKPGVSPPQTGKSATLSRRTFVSRSVTCAGSLLAAGALPGLAAAQVPATANGELIVPPWDQVPGCAASKVDGAGQGPFFIHNAERDDDIDLFRQDIRGRYDAAAAPGTEMQLHLRVLDATSAVCGEAPLAGIEVYIWHVDAQGYYSGFGDPGEQTPDLPYRGKPGRNDLDTTARFCRGAGVTDANGVVSFRSIFPGWYNGRDIHIHFMALKPGSAARGRQTWRDGEHLFTTQFYFEPELIDQVHQASEPYLSRTMLEGYAGAILGDEANSSGIRARASFDGSVVVAQIQVILDPAESRVRSRF